jgi:hypothetical protein
VQLILDLGASFIDLEQKDEMGCTPLLTLARGYSGGYDPAKFDIFLRRGTNLKARDNWGRTCLHKCIKYARLAKCSDEQESLVLLVKKGADVNACDNCGTSISETAYTYSYHDEEDGLAGYLGDLWDAVLSECGHDITEMRQGFPRRPHYARRYTREDFERLWRGREESCPYYNDPPEWDPEKDVGVVEGVVEGIPEDLSRDEEPQSFPDCVVNNQENDTNLDLPSSQLVDSEEVTTVPRPPLSSTPASLGTNMMEPTFSWQNPSSSEAIHHREQFRQVSVESGVSESVPAWQDWPSTP